MTGPAAAARSARSATSWSGAPDDTFPRIDALVVKTQRRQAPRADRDASSTSTTRERSSCSDAPDEPRRPEDQAFYLVDDLFDKQIVDVDGRKVVRINDIEVARTGGALRVVAADIGFGGILRRLGGGRIGRNCSTASRAR